MNFGWHLTRVIVLAAFAAQPAIAQSASFDGVWNVTVSCPAAGDAAGYTLRFHADVSGGALVGENGTPGLGGYLHIAGRIQPNGNAVLIARGLVGNPRVAIGNLPTLTPYNYTAVVHFDGNHGTGRRTTARPCTLDFLRSY